MELTKKEKQRVEVLKDAVKQLSLGVYKANLSGYVDLNNEPNWSELSDALCILESAGVVNKKIVNTEVQSVLPSIVNKKNPCTVCAKGALLISSISKYNNLSIKELGNNWNNLDDVSDDRTREFFGKENADLMESFYEGWDHFNDDYKTFSEDLLKIQQQWNKKYKFKTKEMLIAIFQNAIKNKGTFKPT